jgi:hypothetical protein
MTQLNVVLKIRCGFKNGLDQVDNDYVCSDCDIQFDNRIICIIRRAISIGCRKWRKLHRKIIR